MLGLRRRGSLLQPSPGLGVDLQEPEDGAEEAAGVVRPEVGVRGGVGARAAAGGGGGGGAPAGAAGALVVVGGGGAEGRGLVDLRLAERERQQRPRRVALRGRQRGRHRCGRRRSARAGRQLVGFARLIRLGDRSSWWARGSVMMHLWDGAG